MDIALLLLIVTVIAATAWQLRNGCRRRRRRHSNAAAAQAAPAGSAGQLETLRRGGNYWGVEIRSGVCKAAKELAGRRFPFAEAPCLPLAGAR